MDNRQPNSTEKVQRLSRKGVGASAPKQQETRTVYEIVCSAWQHAAAERRVQSSDLCGTYRMSTPTTSAAIRTRTMAVARAPSIYSKRRKDHVSAAIRFDGRGAFTMAEYPPKQKSRAAPVTIPADEVAGRESLRSAREGVRL